MDTRSPEEHQALLASIVAASDDAIVSKTLDGIIRSWNAGAERIFGYTAAEAVGQPITMIIPPERLDEEREIIARLARGERIEHFETVRVTKDGLPIDISLTVSPVFDKHGHVIGASKIARDISARKRIEAELAASRAELHLVTDHAAVMLTHCDRHGRYLFVNRSYAQRFNLTPQEIIGRSIAEVIGAQAYAVIEAYVRRALAGESVEFEIEVAYDALGPRFMHCVYVPEVDPQRRDVRGFVAAISDVSDRRQLEERLRLEDQRKNEFLAILGHELRNPLAPLTSGLEALQHADGQTQAPAIHQMMRRQLSHLVRLVDDLVDVSRISRGKLELHRAVLDLDAVIAAAAELVRPLMEERGHQLRMASQTRSMRIEGDFERLTQVIGNLLNNAAKYSKPDGVIQVQTKARGDQALVRVRDKGLGIPPDHLESLFELFSQLPEHRDHVSGGGLGIGLALSRQIVELHGGSIRAESEGLGRGSEFTVELPLATGAAAAPALADDASGDAAKGRRILIVDDNKDAAESLRLVLAMLGHDTRAVHDGQAALRSIETFLPDVVLLDIGLPQMNGYEAARRIRALPGGRDLLLVALTGWGQEEDKQRARDAGFDEHLTKPVEATRIAALLASGLEGRT